MRETNDCVFFWTGKDIYYNFYYSTFKHQNQLFKWSEQGVMYRKAKLFGSDKIARKIVQARSPQECKKLGRSKSIPFNEDIWIKEREKIYKEVLIDKFSVPKLKKELLNTGNKILVEASPFDTIWGIGMGENDKGVDNQNNWRGKNLLGKILMEVREELEK